MTKDRPKMSRDVTKDATRNVAKNEINNIFTLDAGQKVTKDMTQERPKMTKDLTQDAAKKTKDMNQDKKLKFNILRKIDTYLRSADDLRWNEIKKTYIDSPQIKQFYHQGTKTLRMHQVINKRKSILSEFWCLSVLVAFILFLVFQIENNLDLFIKIPLL